MISVKSNFPDGETKELQISKVVLLGDTLAHFLFVIVLYYVLMAIKDNEVELGFQLIRKKSRRKPAVAISDLSYANDTALISEEIEQAQELLYRIEMIASEIGLQLNSKKTKIMAFAQTNPVNIFTTLNEQITIVDNFKYLGSWMNSSLKDFKFHKALAWKACQKMKKLWK